MIDGSTSESGFFNENFCLVVKWLIRYELKGCQIRAQRSSTILLNFGAWIVWGLGCTLVLPRAERCERMKKSVEGGVLIKHKKVKIYIPIITLLKIGIEEMLMGYELSTPLGGRGCYRIELIFLIELDQFYKSSC
jgi:hypothetical protein